MTNPNYRINIHEEVARFKHTGQPVMILLRGTGHNKAAFRDQLEAVLESDLEQDSFEEPFKVIRPNHNYADYPHMLAEQIYNERPDFVIITGPALYARNERVARSIAATFKMRFLIDDTYVHPSDREESQHLLEPTVPPQDLSAYRLPPAVIIDLDGVLIEENGMEPWYMNSEDIKACRKNTVFDDFITKFFYGRENEFHIFFLTNRGNREDQVRATAEYLRVHNFIINPANQHFLHRKPGDFREAVQVKSDLYAEHIHGKYHVLAAFDDEPEIIRLWQSFNILALQIPNFANGAL